eukprot:2537047-Pyramimonas_sp.AAC.1
MEGAKAILESRKPLEANLTCVHLIALIRESQRGTCWQVRNADNYVAPEGGTRPGTILATDFFNIVFRSVLVKIRQSVAQLESEVRHAFPASELMCASVADWEGAQADLSFVDDLTVSLIVRAARDMPRLALALSEA